MTELSPSEITGRRIKTLRKSRGWSVRRLVDECRDIGFETTSNAIENIEGIHRKDREGQRRRGITIDELMALALVLDVSPLALLLPAEPTAYPLTETITAPMVQVYMWIIGELERPDMHTGGDPREQRTFARVALRKALPWIGSPGEPAPEEVATEAIRRLLAEVPDGADLGTRLATLADLSRTNWPTRREGTEDGPTEDIQGGEGKTGA